jgi:hypothetical protein
MADFAWLKENTYAYLPSQLRELLFILNAEKFDSIKPGLTAVDKVEFEQLAALSARHKTEYYLFAYFQQFPNLILSEQLQQLREKMTQQAVKSLRQLSELITICKNFNQKGIRYAIIKGPHLARMLYGSAAVKVSVDLDILMVKPEDLPAFHAMLINASYICVEQQLLTGTWKQRLFISAKREVHYYNRMTGCAVDLHVKPLANTILTAYRYRDFFADIEQVPFEGITVPVLPAGKYFVYLCYHGACHQFSRLVWLLDIRDFYLQKRDILDMEKILALARSLNMERPVCLAFMMLNILFTIDIPHRIKSTVNNSNLLKKLAVQCLQAISLERGEDLRLGARFNRMIYLIRLNKDVAGKADVLLSMVMRQAVGVMVGRKQRSG